MNYSSNIKSNNLSGSFVFIFLIIGYIVYIYVKDKKRKEEIKNYCIKNNISYLEKITELDLPPKSRDLKSFKRGKENHFYGAMKIEKDGMLISIFDHLFIIHIENKNIIKGRNTPSSTSFHNETVCLINKTNVSFPKFYLEDKSDLSEPKTKVTGFAKQFIKVDGDLSFSQKFILQGMQEEEVKAFFNKNIINIFKNNHVKGYKYEACNECFMISISDTLDIKQRLELLKNSLKIFNEIISNSPQHLNQ